MLVLCSTAYADEKSHRAAAEELMEVTHVDQMMKPVQEQMRSIMEMSLEQANVPESQNP